MLAPMAPMSEDSIIIPDRYLVLIGPRAKGNGEFGPMSHEKRIEWDHKEEEHLNWLGKLCKHHEPFVAVAGDDPRTPRVSQKFKIGDLRGYSGFFPKDVLQSIRERPEVQMVEMNQVYQLKNAATSFADGSSSYVDTYLSTFDEQMINGAFVKLKRKVRTRRKRRREARDARNARRRRGRNNRKPQPTPAKPKTIIQSEAPWGLSRTSQVDRLGSSPFSYKYSSLAGEGVRVYVVDTGIKIDHVDFGGRAIWGINTVNTVNTDLNGHGTHVSGTVGGDKYGIAKKATIIAVKVLDEGGSGTTDTVLAGIDWVIKDMENQKGRGVINMSLGGGYSAILNNAVDEAAHSGIPVAVAAGNSGDDACSESPSSAKGVFSVGASDINDDFAYFSNYGKCVNIIAPGVNIKSAWMSSKTDEAIISGTSMASPHVAGAMALYLSDPANKSLSPTQIYALMSKNAIKNSISDVPPNTPNLLLNVMKI